MSDATLSLAFDDFARGAHAKGASASGPVALRLALVSGETLRLPRHAAKVRVLEGLAWVSQAGLDFVVQRGEALAVDSPRYPAVVSATGRGALLLEVE